ncbi:MAG TPA: two-component regulator propeller domain-containing protein, partial [Arenibacter sp.]|nr:two-component regulator propeller domain-containing protein [Arenibacter sp.]
MLKRQIILITVFVGLFKCCFAQDYKFHHITTIDGLSHNEVRKIVKDTEGFLWFGTQNGLNRFDGYQLKVFKHVPHDSTTIKADKIYALATSKDKLWVGTTSGISILDTKSLAIVPSPQISAVLDGITILKLYHDKHGRIWVSTEQDNFLIDTETLDIRNCLSSYRIVSVADGLGEYYWIGTDDGLLKYDMENSSIIKAYDIGRFSIYDQNQVYVNSYGEVWATVGDHLYRYQSERDRFVLEHTSKALNFIAENKEGAMFFGSYGGGLLEYSRITGLFTSNIADHGRKYSLSSNDVYDVFVDDENILWVGTQEGLDYYDYTRDRFHSLVHGPGNRNSLRSSFVQSMCGIS